VVFFDCWFEEHVMDRIARAVTATTVAQIVEVPGPDED
jgi:hypothetical protein